MQPRWPVVFLAVLLFAFLILLQASAFVESRSIARNSFTAILTWPDLVYEKVKVNYFENRLPYDEQTYQRLSQQRDQRVTHELAANGPDYIMVYKQGRLNAILKFFFVLLVIIVYISNFYLLALILYWLCRGVKKIVKSQQF